MSVSDVIDIGEPVVLYGDFITAAGAAYDPAQVTLTITRPNGTAFVAPIVAASPAYAGLTKVAVGRFSYAITAVDQNGVWSYTWTPSGGAIDTGHFLVGASGTKDGPCDDWCRPEDIFGCAPLAGVADADKNWSEAADAVETASRWLYLWSGRKYPGICQATVRPCRPAHGWGLPSMADTWWLGACRCGAATAGACACGGVDELYLSPELPVLGVVSVYVDGVVLAASDYRVDDGKWLVRLDGDVWPGSQDLTLNPHADIDTFEVTYYFGQVVPVDGRRAAAALAAQVYADCTGAAGCTLPNRLRSRTRQGDSMDFEVAPDTVGLQAVDNFLAAERYGDANGPAFIVDPQTVPTSRYVGT